MIADQKHKLDLHCNFVSTNTNKDLLSVQTKLSCSDANVNDVEATFIGSSGANRGVKGRLDKDIKYGD